MINVTFPKYFNDLAKDIGKARSYISRKIYKKGSKKYRGSIENKISAQGVLGELIMRHYFDINNGAAEFAPIIDDNPVVGWDLKSQSAEYDIKTLTKDYAYFKVNKEAHNNPHKIKHITHYMFVRVMSDVDAIIYVYSIHEISNWEIYKDTYTDVYRKRVCD